MLFWVVGQIKSFSEEMATELRAGSWKGVNHANSVGKAFKVKTMIGGNN